MYKEQDLLDIENQVKKRLIIGALPGLALLAAFIYTLVIRAEILSYVLSALTCFFIIFYTGVFISPVTSYKKFLRNMLYARNRTTQGRFKCFMEAPAKREGVVFIPFYINVGETGSEDDDRLFYYDSNMPLPNWQPNDVLSITSHDKSVVRWEKIEK